jgi:hypothetical protein
MVHPHRLWAANRQLCCWFLSGVGEGDCTKAVVAVRPLLDFDPPRVMPTVC